MPGIWVFSDDSTVTRQLITAGLELKKAMAEPVCVLTLDSGEQDRFLAAGADKIFVLKGQSTWPESFAGTMARLADLERASVLLVGGTARGKDIAAKVAAYLGAGLVTDAQSIAFADGKLVTTRLVYGGLAVCTDEVVLPALVTIPPRLYDEPTLVDGRQGEAIIIEELDQDKRVMVSNVCPVVHQGVDISSAARIVCVGRGMAKQEDLVLAENLAGVLGAEVACTRGIAEDYHWLPVERYIGISGQKVKPELYISLGVSGQVQHVAGIRDSKIIVAIDTNEKAPIFEAADYGIVGDMYEVVPLLIEALRKQ